MYSQIIEALRRGDHQQALDQAREAVALDPNDPQAHRFLAMALRASGDHAVALDSIDRAIALAPDEAGFHFNRANYLAGMRDIEQAQAALRKSVELDPNQLAAYIMQGQLALSRVDVDEAERCAMLAARVDPEHAWTLMLQGGVALQRNEPDRALELLSRAAQLEPDDAQIRYSLGFAYLHKGHLAFAEQVFAGLMDTVPGMQRLRGLVAELQRQQGRYDAAADTLAPLLSATDATPGLQRFAGELELMAGRHERALPLLRAALAAQPGDPRTVSAIFEAWRRGEDREDARNTLDALLAAHPDQVVLWQARLATEQDDPEAQQQVIEGWIRAMPDAPQALEARLAHADKRGDTEAAEAAAKRIVELLPGHVGAETAIIQALMKRDPAAAVAHVQSLLGATSDDAAKLPLRGWLGLAQDAAGRHEAALATWTALQTEPSQSSPPLPDPAPVVQSWPELKPAADGEEAIAFLVGAPGSGVDRLARLLLGIVPAFRDDRFGAAAPDDDFQDFYLAHKLAKGDLDASAVATQWRACLPARGLHDGQVIDWLLWWDNAFLKVLRPHLSNARLLIALRDPRDMLLDWLAFGAPLKFRLGSINAAAGWLAIHLNQVAMLDEQQLFPHTLIRMDSAVNDEVEAVRAMAGALESRLPTPPGNLLDGRRFAAGHWRDYAQVLAEPFAQLTPVARRLGYPEA